VTHLSTLISCNMKRVQSVADIYTSNDNDGDQCDDSTVFTQAKIRQYKKWKKTGSSTVQTRHGTAEASESTVNGVVSDSLDALSQLQKTVEQLSSVVHAAQRATINS